ncbi:unnamed protein product [Amoebophrya sp. A120]|nr:unnamed protein product [Amoebophrya sp. A120]|eukprot:GSA120T00001875001.1
MRILDTRMDFRWGSFSVKVIDTIPDVFIHALSHLYSFVQMLIFRRSSRLRSSF